MCACVCLSVCLCVLEDIYAEQHVRSLTFLCTLPMAVARCSSGRVTKCQEKGVFFPVDNALYSIAFGTHTKTAESI